MQQYVMLAADLVAIATLVGLFLVRHRRREMVVAYLGVNVGVLAVTATLATSTVGAGLGLGLFGVLSIIRLRSQELAQHEVAYYFAALAIGLVCGLPAAVTPLHAVLLAGVVAAVWVGDHPRVSPDLREHELVLDRAFTDHQHLVAHLEGLLGAVVDRVAVRRTDLVNDTTLLTVRYRPHGRVAPGDPRATGAPGAPTPLTTVATVSGVQGGAA